MRSSARRMTTVEWMDTTVKPPGEATSNNQTVPEATALSPPSSHPSQKPSGFVLNLYPDSAVLGAGFRVVSLARNHIRDAEPRVAGSFAVRSHTVFRAL